jgi:phosphate transport system substrate-binding protein
MNRLMVILCAAALVTGCGREPGSTTLTKGKVRVGCDEAIVPVMEKQIAAFKDQYPDADVSLTQGEARSLVADFANDSVRVIALARTLNDEERDALTRAKVQIDEYEVARTAIAVVAHPDVPQKELRVGELDTIFAGGQTRWAGGRRIPIRLAVTGVNASVTEVFRSSVLKSGGYDPGASTYDRETDLLDAVSRSEGAIGIVSLSWLRGYEDRVTIISVASSAMRPDSTVKPNEYYAPAQAYVFLKYYPVTAPVYLYSREVNRDIALGFISFVASASGQKVFQNNGLVPVTMPVRLVQLTSQQVH